MQYIPMALETHSVNAYADMARFVALRGAVRSGDEDSFAEVAKEFEALFVQLMLRTARDASIEGGLFQSRELEFYNEMLDSQVAMAVATQGSLGFEPMLRQQLIPESQ
jgi:flagellar protein FlgJ